MSNETNPQDNPDAAEPNSVGNPSVEDALANSDAPSDTGATSADSSGAESGAAAAGPETSHAENAKKKEDGEN